MGVSCHFCLFRIYFWSYLGFTLRTTTSPLAHETPLGRNMAQLSTSVVVNLCICWQVCAGMAQVGVFLQ
ncbi:hypothetical protein V8E55_012047 [Tylopilus felleus]